MKFSCVYVEKEVRAEARVQAILQRLPGTPVIPVHRYGEVFNRKSQNFRLQKRNPALILARKHGNLVLPAPPDYGFGDHPGFYFSHLFNCLYDCRYCFLQGMYRSANYVLFTNYEEFAGGIEAAAAGLTKPVFYSGYDCDSLALEPVSRFIDFFVHWFSARPELMLEIRTKSTQVRRLLTLPPAANCVIAMSFTPQSCYRRWEHKVPTIEKRLDALQRLQQQGWPVALRFEPLIWQPDFASEYEQLFRQVFSVLDARRLHSVSIGQFRMPVGYFNAIARLYPDEALFARSYQQEQGLRVQPREQQQEMLEAAEKLLFRHVDKTLYYLCGQN
jgi:spore photoproduct lyase